MGRYRSLAPPDGATVSFRPNPAIRPEGIASFELTFMWTDGTNLPRLSFWKNIGSTMKSLPITLRRIVNSLGIVIPKPVVAQVGLSEQVELTVERGAIVLRKPRKTARSGWSEAAQAIAVQGEDNLLMGEFANVLDMELDW